MKIFSLTLCVFILVYSLSFSSIGESNREAVKVIVNDETKVQDAVIINDRVYVPVRSVSEALGATVIWNDSLKTVKINLLNYDDKVSEIIKNSSPMVVGIIGRMKEVNTKSFGQNIIHGSGFIIKNNGEILTNAHVVAEMEQIVVVLSDGSGYEGKIKYIDEESDLAVIKIQKSNLPVVTFGENTDIVIGKGVVAIGTPISFSLRNSATLGIISGINRGVESSYKLIQTDASINAGNSGGPLITLKGLVIGVNSMKFGGDTVEGMGFSIPVDTIKYVLSHFEKYGKVKRVTIGAEFSEDWLSKLGLQNSEGLEITGIKENSPAQKNGLQLGDLILNINGNKVNTFLDFNEEMKKYLPGDEVIIKINSSTVISTLKIKLEEKI